MQLVCGPREYHLEAEVNHLKRRPIVEGQSAKTYIDQRLLLSIFFAYRQASCCLKNEVQGTLKPSAFSKRGVKYPNENLAKQLAQRYLCADGWSVPPADLLRRKGEILTILIKDKKIFFEDICTVAELGEYALALDMSDRQSGLFQMGIFKDARLRQIVNAQLRNGDYFDAISLTPLFAFGSTRTGNAIRILKVVARFDIPLCFKYYQANIEFIKDSFFEHSRFLDFLADEFLATKNPDFEVFLVLVDNISDVYLREKFLEKIDSKGFGVRRSSSVDSKQKTASLLESVPVIR